MPSSVSVVRGGSVLGIAGAGLLAACASVPPVGDARNALSSAPIPADQIRWPERYRPEDARFFVHNEIEIAAPPKVVWDVLIEAETWPQWYEGAFDVDVRDSATGRLDANSVFTWKTMGLRFESTITEFEPPVRLSWESRRRTIQGYHAWLLVPTATGTRFITDESQHGVLAGLQKVFIPTKLKRLHDVWLEHIKARAEARAAMARAAEAHAGER